MEKFFSRIGKVGGGLFTVGVVLTRFVFVVDGGERGVIFDKFSGVKEKVYGEGMHFMIPLIQVSSSLHFNTPLLVTQLINKNCILILCLWFEDFYKI